MMATNQLRTQVRFSTKAYADEKPDAFKQAAVDYALKTLLTDIKSRAFENDKTLVYTFTKPAIICLTDSGDYDDMAALTTLTCVEHCQRLEKYPIDMTNFLKEVHHKIDSFYCTHRQLPNVLFITPDLKLVAEFYMPRTKLIGAGSDNSMRIFDMSVHVSNWFGCALL